MMFKKFFKFFGGVNELEVKVEALLQEVEDLKQKMAEVEDNIDMSELASFVNCKELANHMDIAEVADNISLTDLSEYISVDDIVSSIQEDIADKVFEKFLEKVKNID